MYCTYPKQITPTQGNSFKWTQIFFFKGLVRATQRYAMKRSSRNGRRVYLIKLLYEWSSLNTGFVNIMYRTLLDFILAASHELMSYTNRLNTFVFLVSTSNFFRQQKLYFQKKLLFLHTSFFLTTYSILVVFTLLRFQRFSCSIEKRTFIS